MATLPPSAARSRARWMAVPAVALVAVACGPTSRPAPAASASAAAVAPPPAPRPIAAVPHVCATWTAQDPGYQFDWPGYVHRVLSGPPKPGETREERELLDQAVTALSDGRPADARLAWLTLVREQPGSRYVPGAYLSFGDYYAHQGGEEARAFYERVLTFPPETNDFYGAAVFGLARELAYERREDDAHRRYAEALAFAEERPLAWDSDCLRRAAERALAP